MKTRLSLLSLLLTSCIQVPTLLERNSHTQEITAKASWAQESIVTDTFILRAYVPKASIRPPTKSLGLTIYIEGDGLAWLNSSTPSSNPTPIYPLALKLAMKDAGPSAYLARPCQFIDLEEQKNCTHKYWTSHRFSEEVIYAIDQAIDQLKLRFGAKQLTLVGYSGGGAVAALVSVRRNDVEWLITIAGNLDHKAWSTEHHLTPLTGSLNPADAWRQLENIPQTHFVGGKDAIVGEPIARAYASNFKSGELPIIKVIPDFDHRCCWEDRWPALKDDGF
jgi:hypothetical protein